MAGKPKWYVYKVNHNTDKVEKFNVFAHYTFLQETAKALEDGAYPPWVETSDLAVRIDNIAMHCFWGKFEYEVEIGPLIGKNKNYKKVDIYSQLKMNYNAFINYIENHREDIVNDFNGVRVSD